MRGARSSSFALAPAIPRCSQQGSSSEQHHRPARSRILLKKPPLVLESAELVLESGQFC
jgi:hypothetical protein